MTMISWVRIKCAVCGYEDEYGHLDSTNSFGPCDLDTRPAPMERDTLSYEINVCSKCGYSDYDISSLTDKNAKEIIKSKEYQKILNSDMNKTIKAFYLHAIIAAQNKGYADAGMSYLKIAWLLDDFKVPEKAIEYRKKAIFYYLEVLKEEKADEIKLMLLDLYRRTEQFGKAIEFANQIIFTNESDLFNEIKEYQIYLSTNKDTACHNLGELENI